LNLVFNQEFKPQVVSRVIQLVCLQETEKRL